MSTLDERATVLDRTAWVRGMSWQQVRVLAGYMTPGRAQAGDILVEEGAAEASACVIVDGTACVTKRDRTGSERTVAELRRGHCFGEISLLDGEPRSATVRATSDVALLTLSGENLERLAEEKPRLAVDVYRRLGRVASQHLRQTSGHLVDVLPADATPGR